MKTNRPGGSRVLLQRLRLMLGLTLLLLMVSCGKDSTGDLSDLLKSVPSDVSAVVAVDVKTLLEKSDCKVGEGGAVTLSPELQKVAESLKSPVVRENVRAVIAGEAGVAPTHVVAFTEGDENFLTFMLDDPDKFLAFAESVTGEKPVATGEIQVCGYMARLANQGWMRVANTAPFDPGRIARYADLSESQSFFSKEIASKFMESDKELVAWADINALVSLRGGSFTDRTVTRMALSTIFDDAADILSEGGLGKNRFTMESRILNSKGGDAKCNFSTSKIDVKTVEEFGGSADLVLAGSVSRQLSKQLQDIMASQFGGVGEVYAPLLKPLDGTFVAAFSFTEAKSDVRLLVTTDGKSPTNDLMKRLNDGFGTVKRDGKILTVGPSATSGDIALPAECKKLSGAWFGMMCGKTSLSSLTADPSYGTGVELVVLKMSPDDGSLRVALEVDTEKEAAPLAVILRLFSR